MLPYRSAAVSCASTAECLRAIEEAQRDLTTLQADFSQVKHVSLLDEPLTSKGRLTLKRPDRLLLQIEEPERLTVLVRDHDIEIPGLAASKGRVAASMPMAATLAQIEAFFTGSLSQLTQTFDVKANQRGEDVLVSLVPHEESARTAFRSIRLVFGGTNLTIREIHLEEPFGDSLAIKLYHIRRNADVPDAAFEPGGEK